MSVGTFQPAPTWAPVALMNDQGQPYFNPVWIDWFLAVVQLINTSGGGGGTVTHNSLGGLQGGTAGEEYHLTQAEHSLVVNFADPLRFNDGSAGAPTYSFTSDTDVGMYRVSANILGFAAGGVEVFRANGATKHLSNTGTAPTITAGGGTSPAIVGKDQAFTVTIGTGGIATSFTVTFNNAFSNAPPANANSDTDIVALKVVTTTTTVVVTATAPFTAGSKVHVNVGSWE